MSEKRFTVRRDEKGAILIPNSILKDGEIIDEKETVDLLNEQQATISHLEKVNGKNFAKRRLLEQDNLVLQNENEQLRKENDKLRGERPFPFVEQGLKRAKAEYKLEKLEKENEQLRKELKELNRKYIAFSEATDKRLKEMMK